MTNRKLIGVLAGIGTVAGAVLIGRKILAKKGMDNLCGGWLDDEDCDYCTDDDFEREDAAVPEQAFSDAEAVSDEDDVLCSDKVIALENEIERLKAMLKKEQGKNARLYLELERIVPMEKNGRIDNTAGADAEAETTVDRAKANADKPEPGQNK